MYIKSIENCVHQQYDDEHFIEFMIGEQQREALTCSNALIAKYKGKYNECKRIFDILLEQLNYINEEFDLNNFEHQFKKFYFQNELYIMFEELSKTILHKIVQHYNLHTVIKGYSKLNKADLVKKIIEFLHIEDGKIKMKSDKQKFNISIKDIESNVKPRKTKINLKDMQNKLSELKNKSKTINKKYTKISKVIEEHNLNKKEKKELETLTKKYLKTKDLSQFYEYQEIKYSDKIEDSKEALKDYIRSVEQEVRKNTVTRIKVTLIQKLNTKLVIMKMIFNIKLKSMSKSVKNL